MAPLRSSPFSSIIFCPVSILTRPDFLATITQHISNKGAQVISYYGWHSNKMRGSHEGDFTLSHAGLNVPVGLARVEGNRRR